MNWWTKEYILVSIWFLYQETALKVKLLTKKTIKYEQKLSISQ